MAGYWSNFAGNRLVPLFNALVWGKAVDLGLQNLASRNQKHPSVVWFDCVLIS